MPTAQKLGLFIAGDTSRQIPLQRIKTEAKIQELVSNSVITQIYEIESQQGNVEVTYNFPLEETASVNSFETEIYHLRSEGDWTLFETIVGKVQTKEKARATYEDAVLEGKSSAALVEKKKDHDVFQVTFMLRKAAGDDVIRQRLAIHIGVVQELPLAVFEAPDSKLDSTSEQTLKSIDELWLRFSLPMTLYPKYQDAAQVIAAGTSAESSNPEQVAEAKDVPYRFAVDVQFESACVPTEVKCSSHEIVYDAAEKRARLQQDSFVDRDFRLYFKTEQMIKSLHDSNQCVGFEKVDSDAPASSEKAILEQDPKTGSCCVLLPIVAPTVLEQNEGNEFYNASLYFVIDCSGSMSGEPIKEAARCLKIFLKSLPMDQGIRIQIVRFGSSFEEVFKDGSALLDDKTLKQAMKVADKMDAELGGTELFGPLEHILASEDKHATGYSKQVFVLTDGEIDRTQETLDMVRAQRGATGQTGKSATIFKKVFTVDPASASQGNAVHTTAAASMVREMDKYRDYKSFGLDSEDQLKELMVKYALDYSLTCSETSFVAVSELVASNEAQQEPLNVVVVPSTLPVDKVSKGEKLADQSFVHASAMMFRSASPMLDALDESDDMACAGIDYKKKSKKLMKGGGLALGTGLFSAIGDALSGLTRKRSHSSASSTRDSHVSQSTGPLDDLMFAQDSRGFWDFSSDSKIRELSKQFLGSLFDELTKLLADSKMDSKSFGTAVALLLLERQFPSDKVTWELIAKKAKLYLKKQGHEAILVQVQLIFDKKQ